MAVALEALHRQEKIKSACVLDIDLHFGDGTVNILDQKNWVAIVNVEGPSPFYFMEIKTNNEWP
jgi:acetoin utilization deacetylase AcuC-like enzyme